MVQLSLLDSLEAPTFDGPGIEPQDTVRLGRQMAAVLEILSDHEWHTLAELAAKAGGSEAGCSARIRDARKSRFGSHVIVRERVSGGLFHYRMES